MTAWYRAGTVTATNGSTTVTGALTAWNANVKIGDLWAPDADERGYEVKAVNGNTEIEIFPAYAGSTGSGKEYGIARISPNWNSVSEISVALADILETQQSILTSTGVPDNSIGQDGDVCFRQDEAEYYRKESGEWVLVTALTGPPGPGGPSFAATSTSSVTVGTGAKTFTVETNRGYTAGQYLRATYDGSNYVEGPVTSYSGTTLVINATRAVGSGTYTAWNINICGDPGPTNSLAVGSVTTGAPGSNVEVGITGSAPSQTINFTIPRGNTGAQGNTGPAGPTGPGYLATSTSSLAIGTGSKTFTTQAGLAYTPGASVRASSAANTSNFMEGTVTSYSSTTLQVNVTRVGGSGTFADWNLNVTGEQGATGSTGAAGADGVTPEFLGDYDNGTTYSKGNIVRNGGAAWAYINETPDSGNAPPTLPTTSNSYWQAVSIDGEGAVNSVNGQTGSVVLSGSDVETSHTPVNYSASGASLNDHVSGIDTAIGSLKSYPLPSRSVSSSATVDLGAYPELEVVISGTTTITSFGTGASKLRFLRFTGSLVLTHNGTSFILPGAVNLITTAGDTAIFGSDSSGNWRCLHYARAAGQRDRLSANRTYYVRTDGSDANNGLSNSSGGAFLTIQKAIDVASALDLSIYSVTINVADGTYTNAVTLKPYVGAGPIAIVGNTTNPENCIIARTGGAAILAASIFVRYEMRGFETRTITSGNAIQLAGVGVLEINNWRFGACAASHMRVDGGASLRCISGSVRIAASASYFAIAGYKGEIDFNNATITLDANVTFTATAYAQYQALVNFQQATWTLGAFSVTGQRYNANGLSLVSAGGAGATAIPGSTSGATSGGGEFI